MTQPADPFIIHRDVDVARICDQPCPDLTSRRDVHDQCKDDDQIVDRKDTQDTSNIKLPDKDT